MGPILAALLFVVIPTDLQARADALSRTASPPVLAWVHDEGARLANASGPVSVDALRTTIRSHFGVAPSTGGGVAKTQATQWAVLGGMNGADIEALAFLVLMQATKSAQEDVQAVMAGVKAINNAKAQQRTLLSEEQKLTQGTLQPTKTPTPAPDRVSQLLAAARGVESKIGRADLSHVAVRP